MHYFIRVPNTQYEHPSRVFILEFSLAHDCAKEERGGGACVLLSYYTRPSCVPVILKKV